MRRIAGLLIALASAAFAGEKPLVVVLDFSSPGNGELGRKVARTFRLKLERLDSFETPDHFEVNEIVEDTGFKPKLDDIRAIADFAREKLKADIIIWGDCKLDGETYTIHLRAMDLPKGPAAPFIDDTYVCEDYPAVSKKARELARRITGNGPKEKFRSPPEGEPGRNLLPNGDFEDGDISPLHWDKVNGLTTFWHREAGTNNRCIRIDTDVYEKEALAWMKRFAAGAPVSQAPSKTPTKGKKYDTMAGAYGVKFYSDYIDVKPDTRYRIAVDAKGKMAGMFFPKVFVKGYRAPTDDRFGKQAREIYRCYLALRVKNNGKWQHFSRVFHPARETPDVKRIRVMLFPYWPPGEYYFDNVMVYEEETDREQH